MKEYDGNAQDQINTEKIGNLPEIKFRLMIVKMFLRLEKRMVKMQEAISTVNTITKDTEEIKNEQTDEQQNY